jgi:hypothetical protein
MNLKFLYRLARNVLPWRFDYVLPTDVIEHRNRIVIKAMSSNYSKDEISQVLTNRRSDFSDQAVISDFFGTEQPEKFIPFDDNVTEAIKVTTESFKPKEKLHPVSFPDLRYYPWNLVPSAEAPWNLSNFLFVPFQSSYDWKNPLWKHLKAKVSKYWNVRDWLRYKQAIGEIKDDTPNFHNLYNELFVYNRTLVHQIKYGFSKFWDSYGNPRTYYWNTLHARSHVVSKDEPDKIRAVFGAPKLLLMIENMFIWQLQRTYLNEDTGRMLWGREIMKGGWKKLYNEILSNGTPNTLLSIDWSQFDKRLLFQLMDIVHDIWKSYFDFSKYAPTSFYPHGHPKDPLTIERLWRWMCYSIKFNPILLPDGRLYRWTYNGFGSGYQQTQLMDSFANMIMILTCLSALGININSDHFWIRIQGDDSLVSFFERTFDIYGPNFLSMLADAAEYYFNAKLNVKKSSILNKLNNLSVLGYFNIYGLPFRTDEDLLRHLYFPERPQDWTRLAASSMGLAMASTGCSIRFYNTCQMIWNELVVKRGIKPYFRELKWMERANMIERSEALEGTDFPKIYELRSKVWCEPIREESAKQRLWPTRPGPAGRFYFL